MFEVKQGTYSKNKCARSKIVTFISMGMFHPIPGSHVFQLCWGVIMNLVGGLLIKPATLLHV